MLRRNPRSAFTLTQLVVLVALLLLLVGYLLAAVFRVNFESNKVQSQNNLKQIAIAMHGIHDANKKMPGAAPDWFPGNKQQQGNAYGPALFHFLPYLEQDTLYKKSFTKVGEISIYAGWACAGNGVKIYHGPGDPSLDVASDGTSYLGNTLALPKGGTRFAAVADGLSLTIFFAEGYARTTETIDWDGKTTTHMLARRYWDDCAWTPTPGPRPFQTGPDPLHARPELPQGLRPFTLQVALGDGSVRAITHKTTPTTFYAACTPNGNEVLGNDW